ncbi:hypothetical protein [Solicola gregarius]|uniref:Uncharacterized protein n=1 Tax=Solicola gregarius TaxID=2908642 RepID=A0AA46YLA2_9ACTN|nr:hypothetical protein [Solicola gregarius]UYM05399.1 hypothetical protein L0C25_23295 [Solicola gregarius]
MAEQNEPVGSLAEELAKLMGVVSGLADRTGGDAESDEPRPPGHDETRRGENAHGASDESRRTGPDGEHAHIADGSAACQVCPVCQTIAFVRSASPEVREQLTASAASLAAAARGLVESFAAQQRSGEGTSARDSRVENIDLSEDGPWD